MDPEDKSELQALVVGFLTQSLKENPEGFTLQEFERSFPAKVDEPPDWYKRYHKKNTLEALQCIPDVVKLGRDNRRNLVLISLNRRSDKVDGDLINLIVNQRSSSKKKRGHSSRPSSRALASFNLNRRSSGFYNRPNTFRSRINHDQHYRDESSFYRNDSPPVISQSERPPFRPSIYNKAHTSSSSRMVAGDPRNRTSMVPPQVRPASQLPISKPKEISIARPPQNASFPKPPIKPVITAPAQPKQHTKEEDPTIQRKKDHVRQRIVSLLKRKLPEIKLLHLNSLYQLEYNEKIDTLELGHNNLTTLLQDPLLSEFIQINYSSGFVTISVKDVDKENVGSDDPSKNPITAKFNGVNGYNHANGQSSVLSSAKAKLDAIDPFNVKNMLQTLEPMGPVKEPPVRFLEVDEVIKYKTMRMIFKSPDNSTLKIDDWESLFESEHRCKIRIRDYGFKTLLDFFRNLEKELPMRVDQKDGKWVAIADIPSLSRWVEEKLSNGFYRAATAIDPIYDSITFPNEVYTFAQNIEDLKSLEFQPVFILSVKLPCSLWVQLRTPARIEAHLCVEAAMTCYEDYKTKNWLRVHKSFIKPGFPCAVFDNIQQRWCRALILRAPERVDKNYDVFALLVDYATTRKYPVSQLLCLMKSHFKYPVGPIYSRLFGVEKETSMEVQKRVKVTLHEFTSPPVTLACKFRREVPSEDPDYLPRNCLEITLYDTRHGRDCNLADVINLPRNQEGDS